MADDLFTEAMAEPGQGRMICRRRPMVISSSGNTVFTVLTPDGRRLPMSSSSCEETSSDSAGFFLAPSLVQAMQRMPGTFPDSVPTSDSTQDPSNLDDDRIDHIACESTQKEGDVESSPDDTSDDLRQGPTGKPKRGGKHLQNTQDEHDNLYRLLESENSILDRDLGIMKRQLDRTKDELKAVQKSNAGLRKSFSDNKTELAEAQEQLKKKDIYVKSIDEYVNELETKIDLLTRPKTSPLANQAQAGTQTDPVTTPHPVQQNNQQEQNTTPGDAVHRWQVYRIKLLEKARDNLMWLNQELTEKEAKAFKDAILFERKLHDNARLMKRHMEICHESNAFLNMDIAEFKMNLDKIRAICDETGEDYSYGFPNSSSIAAVGPDSTLGYGFVGGTDARDSQPPAFVGEADGEQEHEDEEMSRGKSRSSACDSDWSNISVPDVSGADVDGR
jgi:hypothetical protein